MKRLEKRLYCEGTARPRSRRVASQGGRTYRMLFEAFTYDTAGAWSGMQRITQTIRIGYDSDEHTSNGGVEIFDSNGTLIFTGCSRLSGVAWKE